MHNMKITNMQCNHITNPLGYQLEGTPRLSWVVECDANPKSTTSIEVSTCPDFTSVLYKSDAGQEVDSLCFVPALNLAPRTRYHWRVTIHTDSGTVTNQAWFETAKENEPWAAKWISPATEPERHPILFTGFNVENPIASARAYICGVGLYYLALNSKTAGDEVLAPGLCAYDKWLPYQTYDITGFVNPGKNTVEINLGNGWYKGRYGLHRKGFQYGKEFAAICEIVITYEDGTQHRIVTDTTWQSKLSTITDSNIFDGEYRDDTLAPGTPQPVKETDIPLSLLQPRRSPPMAIMHRIKPIEVIHTPAGEVVLDMGQNMVGWFEFTCKAPKGSNIHLQFGEVLQEGNFYRDNLRGALCEFKYVSDGNEKAVTQAYTFYGSRYVKLTDWHQEVNPEDFTGLVIYSKLRPTGSIKTSNEKVNKLFENTLWGQRGNFLDVPTDCPQRDERMGWTGDAQVFFGTAAYNMDVAAFFAKFCYDLMQEQETFGGNVPVVIPRHDVVQAGSCAWGDAATIIPWNHYIRYGDKSILQRQYPSMKAWVDHIRSRDAITGNTRLWKGDFHFCDWLALDNEDPIGNRFGGTENTYLASCFYRYSSMLVAKAARVLGKTQDAEFYEGLSEAVRVAIVDEYVTASGRLALTTQTAYILALHMDIMPEKWRDKTAHALSLKMKESGFHLRTGFIGTSYLCRVLSATGSNNIAYRLLLHEDFPSWLYAVNMGATTIWERWNSILPDGSISDTGMNSLNHYTYGSITEWMYRDAAGIDPIEEYPGFRKFRLAPKPDAQLMGIQAEYHSPVGTIKSAWEYTEPGVIKYSFTVPYGATALLTLPPGQGDIANQELPPGVHNFSIKLPVQTERFTLDTPINELYNYPEVIDMLHEELQQLPRFTMFKEMAGVRCLRDFCREGFITLTDEEASVLFKKFNN